MFCKPAWNELTATVKTPKDICKNIRSYMEYEEDLGDN